MKVNTLVSALNTNLEQLNKQNLQGEVIVINQCDKYGFELHEDNNKTIRIHSYCERGIGKSRNSALMRTHADISVLADDDEVFHEDYLNTVTDAYNKYPNADVILFNVKRNNDPNKINEDHSVSLFNGLKYGAVNITFKNESIRKADIFFSNNFGGGATFGSGEDSKFINDCLKKGLVIQAVNKEIATITDERASTWFKGYNDKFFFDKGALFSAFGKKSGLILGLVVIFKSFRNKGDLTLKEKLLLFSKGYREYKKYSRNK